MFSRLSFLLVLFVGGFATPSVAQDPVDADAGKEIRGRGYPRLSPFSAMRPAAGKIEVRIDGGDWVELVSIHGIEVDSLIGRTRRLTGRRWWKRLSEDLVEVLSVLEGEVGDTVALEVRHPKTGKTRKIKAARMTERNRNAIRDANREIDFDGVFRNKALTAELAHADLQELERLLDTVFAYRELKGVDLRAQIAAAKAGIANSEDVKSGLATAVERVLATFGDGHTRVRSDVPTRPGFMPCLIETTKDGHVALAANRTELIDADRPYVVAIDGVKLEKWLDAAAKRVTQGSPQFVARNAMRELRNLAELRRDLGVKDSSTVTLTLRGKRGTKKHRLDVEPRRRPFYGTWPRTEEHRMLDDSIGYVRIPQMDSDDEFLDGIDAAMQKFGSTKGLIIDVRGNGGGSRAALRRLFPYFMKPKDAPHVANLAAYRMPRPDLEVPDDGFLENRYLYPADWSGWNAKQKAAIRAAAKRFSPEWPLPAGKFSDWHYMVIDHDTNPQAYHYDKPVVILLDENCYSATDIFLGAFKGWRGVTLLGNASGGGSGRSVPYTLANSGIEIRLSSMASFRPNGKLYDGNGIHPDLEVERIASDYLVGGTDTQLEAALAVLRK